MNISRNVLLAALVTFGFNVVADEKQATPSTTTEKAPATPAESKGFFGTVASVVCFPFTFTRDTTLGVTDWVAGTFGAEKFATWLASGSTDDKGVTTKGTMATFFSDHVKATKRVFAVAEVALITAAAYKAYEAFIAEENADEEYVDVFGDEEFDVANN
jgi:hypothetical protein